LDEDFLERYARARKECLEIADRGKDSENESQARIQRDRLRVDTRKWMAARLAPKKYGGQISDDVQGNTTLNFQPAVLIKVGPVEVSPAPEAGSGGLPSLARQPAAGITVPDKLLSLADEVIISLLAGAAVAWPLAARAQGERVRRVREPSRPYSPVSNPAAYSSRQGGSCMAR
jgi:hypothetical protein